MVNIPNKLKKEYEDILKRKGENYLYRQLLGSSYLDKDKYENLEILLLDRSDGFFSLFRQTGNDNFFVIGKILRRVAHKLYYFCLKNGEKVCSNSRFLIRIK